MTADVVGGVWTYALELCHALGRHGVEVALATMGGPLGPTRAREVRDLRNVEVYESAYRLEWMDDAWGDVDDAGAWLRSLEQRLHPDLIHLNGYAHASLDWDAPTVVVAHSCVLSWWFAVKCELAPDRYDEYRKRVKAGLAAADLVVAPSVAMLRELERWYGPQIRGMVIPNGRSGVFFPQGVKQDIVFSAGRLWDEAKNVEALTKLAGKLPWPMYVAGEAARPHGSSIKLNGVTALGRLSATEIAPWFSRAAIYVHPALYEPFGLSILEAALAGCALVLSDIPSLRENWDGAALFFPGESTAKLRACLTELIEDPAKRRLLQARALACARRFSPAGMARKYLAAYQTIADRVERIA